MDFQEFPKMLYLLGDVSKQKIVNSQEEADELGEDWYEQPEEQTA